MTSGFDWLFGDLDAPDMADCGNGGNPKSAFQIATDDLYWAAFGHSGGNFQVSDMGEVKSLVLIGSPGQAES